MSFEAKQRAILSSLADILIPAGNGFPSASDAGVSQEGLDQVLAVRPDLVDGLKQLLAYAEGHDASEVVLNLKTNEPMLYGVLTEFVPGAYFLNEEVRARLGYHGQTPRPIDSHPDYLEDGLLQSVIDRGPIYRPTPRQKPR